MFLGDMSIENHRLKIGGCDAKELADSFGTPLYVVDVARVINTAKSYADVLSREYPDSTVCYASKAFCCTGIYSFLTPLGLGADVVSGGELYTALKGGVSPNKIYFHGNNKTEAEIEFAISSGVECFIVDSERELRLISKHAQKPQNVMVRVNPGIEAHTHRFIQTTAPDSKFGFVISSGAADEIIDKIFGYKNLVFKGLACHIGSQIFETEPFEIAIDKLTDYMAALKARGIAVERLDLGGGFGIKYIEQDRPLSPAEYMKNSAVFLRHAIERKNLDRPRLIVEPGRSIIGEAGITLYTVGAIKEIKGLKTYAAVDGGMFDNPRPALYGATYSALVVTKADMPATHKYSIAGKCCESGDILIDGIALPELFEDDVLAVLSTGAYHYSMASNYNRNCVPPVIAVMNGKADYLVKPQTYEDIIRNDSVPCL